MCDDVNASPGCSRQRNAVTASYGQGSRRKVAPCTSGTCVSFGEVSSPLGRNAHPATRDAVASTLTTTARTSIDRGVGPDPFEPRLDVAQQRRAASAVVGA